MKTIFGLLLLAPTLSFATEVAQLRYPTDFILKFVLEKKNLEMQPDIPVPKFYFESKTPLKQFQDAIESQWGFRPDRFSNAFSVAHNHVYVSDDAEYYRRTGRCMDDSVAHELVHYLQSKYQGWDLSDESVEWQAVEIQTEFREAYCKDLLPSNL